MIPIHTLSNEIEAQVVEAAFKQAGIEHLIRRFEDAAYDGIFKAQMGYGRVFVAEKDAERAQKIILDLSQNMN